MKLTNISAFLLSLIALPMFCACGSDDEPAAPAPVAPPTDGIASVTYGGSTIITNNVDQSATTNTEMTYTCSFDTSVTPYTMTLTMHNANFGSGMPVKLEIEIPDIPLQVTGTDTYSFFVTSLTPLSGGVPQSAVPISNFAGTVAVGANASLTFNFDIAVGFMRPTPGDFTVTAAGLLPVAAN
ncbi:MAG: hypothetical protein NC187_02825 [Candidatus Amulumruptor caecigallinarius]|nr:hypothetical protein [Candidatus Amulumruptor caecigallinarius]MCM1396409.1 hypothetical protein [Candidatus Amulumruptor caecigallinarius]MCM1453534.1 hypothetical protein [bacterium]